MLYVKKTFQLKHKICNVLRVTKTCKLKQSFPCTCIICYKDMFTVTACKLKQISHMLQVMLNKEFAMCYVLQRHVT